jgi:hypothetical protein
MEKHVKLIFGPDTQDGKRHLDVTIGRRLTGADLFRINEEQGQGSTQFQLMVLQSVVTKFGELRMPVPMNVLLSLRRVDSRLLGKAYNDFLKESAGGGKAEKLGAGRYRLAGGFSKGDIIFDVVEFGNHLTGYDEVEADSMEGSRQTCYLMGREIARLSQSSGPATLAGPLGIEMFEPLDAEDIFALQKFEVDWFDSFRPEEEKQAGEVAEGSGVPGHPHQPESDGSDEPQP